MNDTCVRSRVTSPNWFGFNESIHIKPTDLGVWIWLDNAAVNGYCDAPWFTRIPSINRLAKMSRFVLTVRVWHKYIVCAHRMLSLSGRYCCGTDAQNACCIFIFERHVPRFERARERKSEAKRKRIVWSDVDRTEQKMHKYFSCLFLPVVFLYFNLINRTNKHT